METEEDILDAIEQSRRITRLIISAVQKGSKFEVSQILEHYGLAMTSRLHFKVTNIVMEQWFSLMGIDDEEQIWVILQKNPYAMDKLSRVAFKGTMVLSDMLTEWELGIGALQSKVIRRIVQHFQAEKDNKSKNKANDNDKSSEQPKEEPSEPKNDESKKDKEEEENLNNGNAPKENGNADSEQKAEADK